MSINLLPPELQNLGILPGKGKGTKDGTKDENCLIVERKQYKNDCLIFLEQLCDSYVKILNTYDLSSPVHRTFGSCILPTISEENDDPKTPIPWIPFPFEICKTGELNSSDMVVIVENSEQIVQNLTNILLSMIVMSLAFEKTLQNDAKSDNFDIDVVKSFLDEIVIFLDLILHHNHSENLPECWFHFKKFAIQQSQLFSLIMETNEHNNILDFLWVSLGITESQKLFLITCIAESGDYKMVTIEIGADCKMLLDLQERFIIELIAIKLGSNKGIALC